MEDISILIGGKAGFGIDTSSLIIARILNRLGYRIYVYRDYPSLIRGGHTFSIIRASNEKITSHHNKADYLLALNQDTVNLHADKLNPGSAVLYDSNVVNLSGALASAKNKGLAITELVKEESANEIMRNTCIIGSFCKASGIKWEILDEVLRSNISREIDINLKIARKGYDSTEELKKIEDLKIPPLPILTGNEAVSLGLFKAGLDTYIAYPMTPSSGILHFLAEKSNEFGIKVIHPESEIAVMLMALGAAYAGEKVTVGTSGGGFCLMTEGLSFSGMSELPLVIVLGQRTGPSTGLPTYTGQTELHFALNSGQGEFPRFIVAPGDAEEAYYWSAIALNMAIKYQIPSIILTDKTLAEGAGSFDLGEVGEIKEELILSWDKKDTYKRYLDTKSGVSPLAFAPEKDAVTKINSYEHDEYGITTEEAAITKKMQDKRLRKEKYLAEDLENYQAVGVYGNQDSSQAIICWGSNKGVSIEAAKNLNLKVIQPRVLWPFPLKQFKAALKGVKKTYLVENSATAQLAILLKRFNIDIDKNILKYDGRPFTADEIEKEIKP